MKTFLSKQTKMQVVHCLLTALLLITSCSEINPSRYTLEFPELPVSWTQLFGSPVWRVEWVDPGGQKQKIDILSGSNMEIDIPVTWPNPVTAWPYWPHLNLLPGFFKPAGALFPFDVNGNCLPLTWKAGPDTVFYWELALANEGNLSRIPANFDWPRFRELFKEETMNKAVREDPWLVNWSFVAERTIANGFDRRRLVPESAELREIPVSDGYWHGTSPFVKPIFITNDTRKVFPIREGINIWVSSEGILRVNGDVWIFIEWQ